MYTVLLDKSGGLQVRVENVKADTNELAGSKALDAVISVLGTPIEECGAECKVSIEDFSSKFPWVATAIDDNGDSTVICEVLPGSRNFFPLLDDEDEEFDDTSG